MPATYKYAGDNTGASNRRSEIGLQNDQSEEHQNRCRGREQRVPDVIHHLRAGLKKVCEKQNQYRLSQLGGLEGKASSMDPPVGVVRSVEEEDGDQQKGRQAHERKHQRRMLVAPVVEAHRNDHGDESGNRPDQLF